MKKNILLKIACLLEFIFIIFTLISTLTSKLDDASIFQLFILLIDIILLIILFKESFKEEKFFVKNSLKVKLISIWFFIETIIPGILGFIFISKISKKYKKNSENLPVIKEEKYNKKDILKGISLLVFFIIIQFILPLTSLGKKIPDLIYYIFIFTFTIVVCFKDIKNQFKVFLLNKKVYIKYILMSYLKMFGIVLLCSIPVVIFNNSEQSANQVLINEMFKKSLFKTFVLSALYAPLIEELIFRYGISKLIKNKWLFIITSGLIFGSLHMIDKLTSFMDIFYIIQYSALGMCLAYFYKKTNNIFVSIGVHFIQNFLASILSILLLF